MTKRYNQETRELILQLNEQGQSVPSLAHEYGISEATIYNWKKEYTPYEETGKSQTDLHQMEKEEVYLRQYKAFDEAPRFIPIYQWLV
ncbi:transposase [Tetragenococcus halophilus]|uniref:Transposase n=1 Tax=Tetragenococcus halophilus (strain DSM 20338 / JCM 20259 / NCIMB 9735 / NBRC 12172) TaxID=945021 RepID=A0AAN1SFQ6_TETHN|nr:transposase [Tetragenococcus halophilus]BAK93731.1 putative transposase [Tetragenococcus halophilus NBRC 12172]GBD71543.1 putative transposase [Tetragenococcus halophilus subsp. halophilus]GMG69731.1 transposase [Tetragenococcus halophilus]